MSKKSEEDSYFFFRYASKQVKKKFKQFLRCFTTLAEAINAINAVGALVSLYDHLNSKYRFA